MPQRHQCHAPAPHGQIEQRSPQQRVDELGRLLPLWPNEAQDVSVTGRKKIVSLIERALRHERQRARSGHWAYDVARHSALYRVWQRERMALMQLLRQQNISRYQTRQKDR